MADSDAAADDAAVSGSDMEPIATPRSPVTEPADVRAVADGILLVPCIFC